MNEMLRLEAAEAASAPIRVVLAYNPASGHYRADRIAALTAALVRHGFAPSLIPTRPDGIDIPADASLVCVAGGDGTLRMVAAALGGRVHDVPLAVFPSGTVNLVARELGYSPEAEAFARQIAAGWIRPRESWPSSPHARHDGKPLMACLSVGPDSAAVAHFSPALKLRIGRVAYVAAFAKLLWRWPRYRIAIHAKLAEGGEIALTCEAAFVSRARYYAGPFTLSPGAALNADALHLVVMPRASRTRALAFAAANIAGLDSARLGLARHYRVTGLRFDNCTHPVQVDGDAVGACAGEVSLTGAAVRFCI